MEEQISVQKFPGAHYYVLKNPEVNPGMHPTQCMATTNLQAKQKTSKTSANYITLKRGEKKKGVRKIKPALTTLPFSLSKFNKSKSKDCNWLFPILYSVSFPSSNYYNYQVFVVCNDSIAHVSSNVNHQPLILLSRYLLLLLAHNVFNTNKRMTFSSLQFLLIMSLSSI